VKLGAPLSDEATAFVTLIHPIARHLAGSVGDLGEILAAANTPEKGVLLVSGDSLEDFPMSFLAQTLAEHGWVVDTIAELDYEAIQCAVAVRRGSAAPWVNPALGPRPPLTDEQSRFMSRFTPSLYVLERFEHASRTSDRTMTPVGDDERVKSKVLRERRRSDAQRHVDLDRARADKDAVALSLADVTERHRELRESKRFLLGSFLAESVRRPRRAFAIAKKLSARKTASVAKVESGWGSPSPIPSFQMEGFVQPPIVAGAGPQSISMIASRHRREAWSSVAKVSMPIPGMSVETLVSAPKMLVIEASALLEGRWSGVGQMAEMIRTIELLDFVDAASLSGIPSIFVWDVPPGVAPGVGQIARAASVVVASDSVAATALDLPIVGRSFDVAEAARSALCSPPLPRSVLAVDADVSLGGLPVRSASSRELLHGSDHPHLRHGVVWFGGTTIESLQAAAAARGAGTVSATDPIGLQARDRPIEYRDLSGEAREARAQALASRGQSVLHQTQRSLYLNYHPSVEIAVLGAFAGVDWQPRSQVGIVMRCASDDSRLERLLMSQVLPPNEVVIIDDLATTISNNLPGPPLHVVARDGEALELMRRSPIDGWIVVDNIRDEETRWHNAVLDASRLLSYGLDEVQVVNSSEPVATVIASSQMQSRTTLMTNAGSGNASGRPLSVSSHSLGWTT
jgi:hypothetical protein